MAETYDIYFGLPGDLQLISAGQSELSINVPYNLEYSTTYNWRVDATEDEETVTGDVWSFTTLDFLPPAPSTRTVPAVGGGNKTIITGENNMLTKRRVVVCANNKVFYESDE